MGFFKFLEKNFLGGPQKFQIRALLVRGDLGPLKKNPPFPPFPNRGKGVIKGF